MISRNASHNTPCYTRTYTTCVSSVNSTTHLARLVALAYLTPVFVLHESVFAMQVTQYWRTLDWTRFLTLLLRFEIVPVSLAASVDELLALSRLRVEIPARADAFAWSTIQGHFADGWQQSWRNV